MARTKGSNSLVAVGWQDLRAIMGDTFSGKVVVSQKWLDSIEKPFELVMVKEGDADTLPIDRSVTLQPDRRPRMIVED